MSILGVYDVTFDPEQFWSEAVDPDDPAQITRCQAFAGKHSLKLPSGIHKIPTNYVWLFIRAGIGSLQLVEESGLSLTDKQKQAIEEVVREWKIAQTLAA